MSARSARILPLALAILFFGALFAAPAQSVTPQQNSVVLGAVGDDRAAGTTYVSRATLNRFWMTSDPTQAAPAFFADGSDLTNAALNHLPPTDADCAPEHVGATTPAGTLCSGTLRVARIDQTGTVAVFPMPASLAAVDPYHVFNIQTKMLAGCDVAQLGAAIPGLPQNVGTFGIDVRVFVQKAAGAGFADDRDIAAFTLVPSGIVWANDENVYLPGQAPYAVMMYTGSSRIGDASALTGPLIMPGERLAIEYSAGFNGQCFLYYGASYEGNACVTTACPGPEFSELTLQTDAARVLTYMTDKNGEPATGFPSANSIDSSERRILVNAIYASALGPGIASQLIDQRHANVRLYDLDKGAYLYHVDNTNSVNCISSPRPCGGFPREYEVKDIRLISSRADNVYPEPDVESDLGQGVVLRTYVFAYNSTQPDVKRLRAEFYSQTDGWQVDSPLVSIGGKGIAFSLLEGESATHRIVPGESTVFSFLVRNTGTATDVVTVTATDPGAGWTATVLGGGKYFLTPGGVALGQVEVKPPAGLGSGSRSIVLRATSSFPDVTDPATFSLTTTLTNEVVHDVELAAQSAQFAIKAGTTKGFPVTIANLGTQRESFVVLPSIPANVQGYTVVVQPASLQVPAGGTQQLTVTIKAPAETPSITAWSLGLTAVAVGDSAVSDRIDAAVTLIPIEGLLADILDPNVARSLRSQGQSCFNDPYTSAVEGNAGDLSRYNECPLPPSTPVGSPSGGGQIIPDQDFDRSAVFRVTLNNAGDVAERYRAEGFWDVSAEGTDDGNLCDLDGPNDSLGDGVPDGWRFHWNDAVGEDIPESQDYGTGQYPTFSGRYQLSPTNNPIIVPAHSSRDVYLEIGHVDIGCTGNFIFGTPVEDLIFGSDLEVSDTYSSTAKFVVSMTSLNDPAKLINFPATVNMAPAGQALGNAGKTYSGGVHVPAIEAANETVGRTLLGNSAVIDVYAINKGNEHDDLVVKVAGDSRWTHSLIVASSAPEGRTCALPAAVANGQSMVCPGMGVYDEVRISVVATPGSLVRVGDIDPITVTVASGDAPGIERSLNLVAQATGTFVFSTSPLGSTSRSVAPGASVSFPFFIANQGTSADSYRLSLLSGSNDWKPVLSSSAPVFVPSGLNVPAHLTVTAPANAASGLTDLFKVQVESVGNGVKRTFEVSPTVQPAGGLVVTSADGTDVLIPTRGVAKTVNVTAVNAVGAGTGSVVFTPDRASLPPGWTVEPASVTSAFGSGTTPAATAAFQVTAPSNALGTARGILHVDAATTAASPLRGATDVNLNLASTFGLQLNVTNGDKQVIAPGGPALFNLTITNLGLGADTVQFTNSAIPAGWQMQVNPPALTLGPLERADVQVTMRAPTTAPPAAVASVILFARSVNDAGTLTSLPLLAQVGFNAIELTAPATLTKGAPQETLVTVVNVTNTGTLRDEIRLAAVLDSLGLADHVGVTVSPSLVAIKANETIQVTVSHVLGPAVPGNNTVQATLRGASLLDERPEGQRATASLPVQARVLPYAVRDINGDGLNEYAVDRNDLASDGLEQFRPTLTPGGTSTLTSPDVTVFLREDAIEALSRDVTLDNGTTVRRLVLTIDGDKDSKTDLFVDRDGDNQPDYYWDGDANLASPIEFRKDVNGDQVPELFVDTKGGDGRLDAVYDLTRGKFTPVFQVDVDGDGKLDYIIDKNEDGIVDEDETVLYIDRDGVGTLLIVQKVDVDGDGKLDQVFDTDGDGNPDYFIPNGTTQSVEIVLRDVNGDGVQDWTFDGDNDGRRESYYDPATGKAHVVDAAGHFLDALRKYWYIGALFVVILALFVALILVTRR
jgi:uncharacterized membrane protein